MYYTDRTLVPDPTQRLTFKKVSPPFIFYLNKTPIQGVGEPYSKFIESELNMTNVNQLIVKKPKLTKIQKLEKLKTKCTDIDFINQSISNYQKQTKNVVEQTLMMCETVNSIHRKVKKGELKEYDLDYFCNCVGLDKNSSTFRKFICISKHSETFKKYIDKVPSTISVLYEITTLDPDMFEMMIKNNLLHQFITLSEVKKLSNKVVMKTISNEVCIKIEFDVDSTSQESLILINQIKDSLRSNNEIKVHIQNESSLDKFLEEMEGTV